LTATWHDYAHDLGMSLRDSADPLVVVLGAGASASSGGPSTGAVEALLRAHMTRVPPDEVNDRLHEMPPADVRGALSPMFARLVPYIGYRCLAALARGRRVVVMNLNWDPTVQGACELLGVPYVAYDIQDRAQWAAAAGLPEGRGVVVVHLHGMIDGDPRHGARRTLGFDRDELQHLRDFWAGGRRVVVGTSLDHAHDVIELLAGLTEATRDAEPQSTWAFMRSTGLFPDELRGRYVHVAEDPALDFDALVHALLDTVAGDAWKAHRKSRLHSAVPLPSITDFVWPDPTLLRPALDRRLVALIGDPQLGKTTLAHFLAHLHVLLHGGEVRAFSGPDETASAVPAGPDTKTTALILENPFGEDDFSPNGVFVRQLLDAADDGRLLIVTSRLAAWQEARVHGQVSSVGAVLNADPDKWYRYDDLTRLAASLERPGVRLTDKVQRGWLDTPARIRDQARGVHVAMTHPNLDREDALRHERLRLLADDRRLATLATLTRLQEIAGAALPAARLFAAAEREPDPVTEALFHRYEWEGEERLRLRSQVERQAVDEYLDGSPELLDEILHRSIPMPLRTAAGTWRTLSAVRAGPAADVSHVPDDVMERIGGRLLSAAPTEATLARLLTARLDQWAAADVAYPLVRMWNELPDAPRRALLDRLLDDRAARGAYAVLEACLYLQGAAPAEVWTSVKHALDTLPGDAGAQWERVLAFDGLLWRPPRDHTDDAAAWAHRVLELTGIDLRGVIRFGAAYHREGLAVLGLAEDGEQLQHEPWTVGEADLVARLVGWHFAHQSHARAQLGGQHWVDKEYLCRTLHPAPEAVTDGAVHSLLAGLIEHGHAGWAFHLGCNLRTLGVELEDGHVRRLIDAIRAAPAADPGIVTAVATYEFSRVHMFSAPLAEYFATPENRAALLDGLRYGVEVFGERVTPPRFGFVHRPGAAHRVAGVRFERLQGALGTADPQEVVHQLEAAAAGHVQAGTEPPDIVAEVLDICERGDLRPLELAAAAFGDEMPPAESMVLEAARQLGEERRETRAQQ
jgi:hypothetical protein